MPSRPSRRLPIVLALSLAILTSASGSAAEPLRIIVFGAHPDDCEYDAGGAAALWAKAGYKVKFVAVTNGDIGHHEIAGAVLGRRRAEEARRAAAILGVETDVLDNHDGELMPTLENRRTITRKIREWRADVVVVNRPNDYHPDHRYTGILVQDAAFMVTVPSFCPEVPALRKNPVFLYTEDEFKKPNAFVPDVVVPIDTVVDLKVGAFDAIESQFYEWEPWMGDDVDQVPRDKTERRKWLDKQSRELFARTAERFRDKLIRTLGPEQGTAVKYAEAFEVCEYGSQPSKEEIARIFPFLGKAK
jgi:LmbE family N-acetylglucosaminyl deacetylase